MTEGLLARVPGVGVVAAEDVEGVVDASGDVLEDGEPRWRLD